MPKPKNEIQILTQLGEGFAETIDRFEPAAAQLHEATKTINEQVASFKTLSQAAQEQIKLSIKEATHQIAETVAKEIVSSAEKQIFEVIQPLDRSAQYASRALHDTKVRKRMRMAGFICLGCIIAAHIGFGGGYYFGCQRINLPVGVKVLGYPISSAPQSSSQKPKDVGKGAKKKDLSSKK